MFIEQKDLENTKTARKYNLSKDYIDEMIHHTDIQQRLFAMTTAVEKEYPEINSAEFQAQYLALWQIARQSKIYKHCKFLITRDAYTVLVHDNFDQTIKRLKELEQSWDEYSNDLDKQIHQYLARDSYDVILEKLVKDGYVNKWNIQALKEDREKRVDLFISTVNKIAHSTLAERALGMKLLDKLTTEKQIILAFAMPKTNSFKKLNIGQNMAELIVAKNGRLNLQRLENYKDTKNVMAKHHTSVLKIMNKTAKTPARRAINKAFQNNDLKKARKIMIEAI